MIWLPADQWRAATPPVQLPRSGTLLHIVVRQFDVERHVRYRPVDGKTWCNIFASDVCAALGVVLPHWVDDHGDPPVIIAIASHRELTANNTADWLDEHGRRFGWGESARAVAEQNANDGFPVVAIWKNTTGSGHVAVLVPGGIAQAGKENFNLGTIERGFGDRPVRFFSNL